MAADPAAASRRNLLVLLRWCRRQAEQPDADPLWATIAAEIDSYLGDDDDIDPGRPPQDGEALF